MNMPDDVQLKRIEDDLDAIKSVLNKNIPLFRTLVAPDHLKLFSLIAGGLFFVIPGVYQGLIFHYGSYALVPSTIKTVMLFVVALAWIIAGITKNLLWIRSLGKNHRSITWGRGLREFFTPRIVHVYAPVLLVAVVLVYFLIKTDNVFYVIPACGIGTGLMYNIIGTISDVWQYLVSGYWFVVSSVILLFNPISAPIAIMVCFGVGFVLFFLFSIRRNLTRGAGE